MSPLARTEAEQELAGRTLTVGVIGDFQPEFPPHPATNAALEHAAAALGIAIDAHWLGTVLLREIEQEELERFDALWCAPEAPTKASRELCAIRYARERDRPLLGTCGGFQHLIIEYARNVLGFDEAQHAEYDPYSSELLISELSCSRAGKTMSIKLTADSIAGSLYGRDEAREQYYCNFGLNPDHRQRLEDAGLRVVGEDQDSEARVIELPQLRFYLGTLFVPQLRSAPGSPHPLILGLLEAALQTAQSGPDSSL